MINKSTYNANRLPSVGDCVVLTDLINHTIYVQSNNEYNITKNVVAAQPVLETFIFVVGGIGMSLLGLIGIILNFITVFLFSLKRLWAGINYYLIALAIWDSCLLFAAWLLFSTHALSYKKLILNLGPKWIFTYRYSYTLINVSMWSCIWLTLAITIERWFVICHPLRHKTLANNQRAKIIVSTICIAAVSFGMIRFFEIKLDKLCDSSAPSGVVYYIETSDLYKNRIYFILLHVVFALLLEFLGPLLIIIALSARMIQVMHRSRKQREYLVRVFNSNSTSITTNAANHSSRQMLQKRRNRSKIRSESTNWMLVAVVVKFVLCYIMPTIIDIIEHVVEPELFESHTVFKYLVQISNFTVVFNSATNFIIYIKFSRRFRIVFFDRIVHCRCYRKTLFKYHQDSFWNSTLHGKETPRYCRGSSIPSEWNERGSMSLNSSHFTSEITNKTRLIALSKSPRASRSSQISRDSASGGGGTFYHVRPKLSFTFTKLPTANASNSMTGATSTTSSSPVHCSGQKQRKLSNHKIIGNCSSSTKCVPGNYNSNSIICDL